MFCYSYIYDFINQCHFLHFLQNCRFFFIVLNLRNFFTQECLCLVLSKIVYLDYFEEWCWKTDWFTQGIHGAKVECSMLPNKVTFIMYAASNSNQIIQPSAVFKILNKDLSYLFSMHFSLTFWCNWTICCSCLLLRIIDSQCLQCYLPES